MDCVDCHNRPTHAFDLPERAVDRAMSEGRINAQLPFIKKQAVALLKAEYPDRDTGSDRILKGVIEFYKTKYPSVYQQHRVAVEAAGEQVKAIYQRNIFPSMKITWGTYVTTSATRTSSAVSAVTTASTRAPTERRFRTTARHATRSWRWTRRIRRSSRTWA
jgi:hypothetical protein